MSAVAQHHIEHDNGYLWVAGFLLQPADTQFVVQHRVQTANGELIFAQINDGMLLAYQ